VECNEFCSEDSTLGVSKYWSFKPTVTLKRVDNCFCYPINAVPTPQDAFNSGEVQRELCGCDNGKAFKARCPKTSPQKCKSCEKGFDLIDGLCVEKQCLCAHGIGSEGKKCPLDGAWNCRTCKLGFHQATNVLAQNDPIEQELCVENLCKCKNGFAAKGTDSGAKKCDVNDTQKCKGCTAGYFLLNEKCVENECTCLNGKAATGLNCPVHGDLFCVNCDDDFHLEFKNGKPTGKCISNDSEKEDILV
jgi:hypothetical protein